MGTTTKPLFTLYVAWHPSNPMGDAVAELLRQRFGPDRYSDIAGGPGLSVLNRSESAPGTLTPLSVDWDESDVTAAVVLVDAALARDPAWQTYVKELRRHAAADEFHNRLFPVQMETDHHLISQEEQALRWDQWTGSDEEKQERLVRDLTHEFIRMLRHHLDTLKQPDATKRRLEKNLEKFPVFISHTKQDDDGTIIAGDIRDWIHKNSGLSSFFDFHDIPPGMSFKKVLLHSVATNAVLVVHTDAYSSRVWCRREVIEAKRHQVPMVVVDCLCSTDPRSIPYMGNVPIVRMNPKKRDRIGVVVGRLLDEAFRDLLWRCRVEPFRAARPDVAFVSRPPELISLALPRGQIRIVYPDPAMGADDALLFSAIAPNVNTHSLTEWLEGVP